MPDVARRGRQRRRQDNVEEEEEDGSGFGGWKLGMVIGVIVVCFAVVYPHVFHPLLMSLMGRSDAAPAARSDRPPMHPGMAGRGPTGSRAPGADAHPAMRMASAQAEAQGSKGGAKSMYTFMIPIYTVGVIAFLLYTMFKSKKKNRRNRNRRGGSDDEYSDDEEEDEGRGRGKPLAGRKMRDLQDRLKQTESAMSKILEQLEKAQSEGKLTPEMMANLGDQAAKAEKGAQPKPATKTKKSSKKEQAAPAKVDKTPDTEAKPLPDEQTTQYMEDLEKALSDFKQLSDMYEDAQGGRRRRQASESEESEGSPATEDLSSEDEDVDEEEEEDSKASSAHPFPEEDNAQDDEDDEEKIVIQELDSEEEEEVEEEPAREPTPPPPNGKAADDKVRRRKAKKI